MRFTLTITLAVLLSFASVHAQDSSPKTPDQPQSDRGKYLGNTSTNIYSPNYKDSIHNPVGRYGSPISPDSIRNPLHPYNNPIAPGSPSSPLSGRGVDLYMPSDD